jgi:hypothetical protein
MRMNANRGKKLVVVFREFNCPPACFKVDPRDQQAAYSCVAGTFNNRI